MRKEYIIKDARKILAEQINNSGTPERNVMDENPITMSKGLLRIWCQPPIGGMRRFSSHLAGNPEPAWIFPVPGVC